MRNATIQPREKLWIGLRINKGDNMPTYDFKCNKCGQITERRISFEESEKGFICPDSHCNGLMKRKFPSRISISGCNRFMRKKGIDAKQDRYYANKSLEEKGKLPKEIKPERGI